MDRKTLALYVIFGLNTFKEIWEAISDKPVIIGVFSIFSVNSASEIIIFLSEYWLLIISVIGIFALAIPDIYNRLKGLNFIIGKRFVDEVVIVDGNHYVDCIFDNCIMRWNGGAYAFQNLHIIGKKRFETQNALITSAITTLKTLGFLEKEFSDNWHLKPKEYFEGKVYIPKEEVPMQKNIDKKRKKKKIKISKSK